MKYKFREHAPVRTCTKKYADFHRYKSYLEDDFQNRCAYCNLNKAAITTPFEIDHYIPLSVFKNDWPELETTYDNLILACKKCNRAKSNQYEGDLSKKEIVNELFYDPVLTEYNDIFYRNEMGEICSNDAKGLSMISKLRLYRPIHSSAWVSEQLGLTCKKLKKYMDTLDPKSEAYKKLKDARYELMSYYTEFIELFLANYND